MDPALLAGDIVVIVARQKKPLAGNSSLTQNFKAAGKRPIFPQYF
jgi:hypothetical protein